MEESSKKAGENLNEGSFQEQVKFFDLESKLFGLYSAKIEKIILALSDNEPIIYLLDAQLSEYELRLLVVAEELNMYYEDSSLQDILGSHQEEVEYNQYYTVTSYASGYDQ